MLPPVKMGTRWGQHWGKRKNPYKYYIIYICFPHTTYILVFL